MCVYPSSPSGSNSDAAAALVFEDNSGDEADSQPVLTDFSNLMGALHNAVDAIREQNGLPPVVSDASRLGPCRYDVCPGCRGKPTAVVCPSCGRSVTAGGEERWAGWLPW